MQGKSPVYFFQPQMKTFLLGSAYTLKKKRLRPVTVAATALLLQFSAGGPLTSARALKALVVAQWASRKTMGTEWVLLI